MPTPHFIARQLSHPRGMFGRFIAALMNWHNANMNSFAVRQLALDSRDRVLEIGFGGGVTLQPLLKCAAYVAGIDRSRDMVEHAKRRYFDAVQAGRAEFREGNVESMPFASGSFDKVCTVNTIYFWPSLEAAFREILRVLAPGGRLVVGFLPKERMDRMGVPPISSRRAGRMTSLPR
jgi:arsenite methyltransferase